MAKINNQAVMQKLIDELKLYPGKDLIPSELADKILAVYQVNDQEVTVKTPTANVVRTNATQATNNSQTIYTTPATGKFYLTNASISAFIDGNGANMSAYLSVTVDGIAQKFLYVRLSSGTTGTANIQSHELSNDFQNPILVDPATNITVTTDAVAGLAYGSIVGHTE